MGEGIDSYLNFIDQASDLVIKFGGSFSGEYGDGQARGPLLQKMFGDELITAFRTFKSIWDPDWKMNPGKMIDAYAVTLIVANGFSCREQIAQGTGRQALHLAQIIQMGFARAHRVQVSTFIPSRNT